MLLTLLEQLEESSSKLNFKLNHNQVNELKEMLEYYKGGIIPIGPLRRELDIELKQAQEIMMYLEIQGVLQSKFKVICPDKSESIREELYDDIRKIPLKVCDKCDNECSFIENVVVCFKVVYDE